MSRVQLAADLAGGAAADAWSAQVGGQGQGQEPMRGADGSCTGTDAAACVLGVLYELVAPAVAPRPAAAAARYFEQLQRASMAAATRLCAARPALLSPMSIPVMGAEPGRARSAWGRGRSCRR